jgi:hypothetical protein
VKVVPLMDKALTPYVKGGGATAYEAELKYVDMTRSYNQLTCTLTYRLNLVI